MQGAGWRRCRTWISSINNAGIFEPKGFFDIPDEDWSRFFEVNVMSGVRLSRAYLPGMLKRNWGRIVFISSESALNIPKEMIHYGMTKTAQLAMSRGLAEMTRGTAVTVNSVLPGPTMSEGVETFVKDLAKQNGQSVEEAASQFVKQFRPTSLLQRFASVEEIANMVVYVSLEGSLGHQWRGASRRGRYRPDHRVRCGMSAYVISEVDVQRRGRLRGLSHHRRESDRAIWRPLSGPRRRRQCGRRRPAAEEYHRRRISVDGTPARMVRLAGICRGAQAAADRAGPPPDFCRGRADGLVRHFPSWPG